MTNIIISGATSCIGMQTVVCFLERGFNVTAIARPNSKSLQFFLENIPSEYQSHLSLFFREFKDYDTLLDQIGSADAWVNFAWGGTGRAERENHTIQQNNVSSAMKAMETAYSIGCNVYVEAGSQAEYGRKDGPTSEDSDCAPFTEYGTAKLYTWTKGKLLAEAIHRSYLHLRIFSVFGPGKLNDLLKSLFSYYSHYTINESIRLYN